MGLNSRFLVFFFHFPLIHTQLKVHMEIQTIPTSIFLRKFQDDYLSHH